nr:MAG TPA: hypothetical protein [Caudoviricetes sp.]
MSRTGRQRKCSVSSDQCKNGRIDIGTLQRFNHVSVERRCSTCQQI